MQRGDEIGVRRAEAESARAQGYFGLGFRQGHRVVLVQFTLAFQDAHFLVERLDLRRPLFQPALLFKGVDFLFQRMNFRFQGFNICVAVCPVVRGERRDGELRSRNHCD